MKSKLVILATLIIPVCISAKANFAEVFNEANTLFEKQLYEQAIAKYQDVIELNPHTAQAYFNMGLAFASQSKTINSIHAFKSAIEVDPAYTKAHLNLASAYEKTKQPDKALEHYEIVCTLEPHRFSAHQKAAEILNEKMRFEEAATHLALALEHNPRDINLHFEYANTLNIINKTEEALVIYQGLLSEQPNNTSIAYNIAYTLKKLGRLQEAFPYYQQVLQNDPNHQSANFSCGLAYLVTGDFEKGWEKYEWRENNPYRTYTQPIWDGSNLEGKTIFLYAEQGLGDTFQFIRYAKIAKEKGGHVVVAVQKPLPDIIRLCPYIDRVIGMHDEPGHFDVHAPMVSLPYILRTVEATIPHEIPYLFPDPAFELYWRHQLAKDKNFKIGICWQGNKGYRTAFLRAAVAAKSVSLQTFAPLAQLPGISLYNLQKINGEEQLHELDDSFPLHIFEGNFDESHGRFMDTAAVIKNLDLVITIDTSIAHLAGGLGTPTWVLIPEPPDWRWMLERTDTPWYPNMRLFRQPVQGDWDTVMQDIVQALQQEYLAH